MMSSKANHVNSCDENHETTRPVDTLLFLGRRTTFAVFWFFAAPSAQNSRIGCPVVARMSTTKPDVMRLRFRPAAFDIQRQITC
jgi:hypothetical protein